MGSDIIVALKEASANGTTLFGLNQHAPRPICAAIRFARWPTLA